MADATFEDGGEKPLRLKALDADDLSIISMLCQDAVLPASEIKYDTAQRRVALLVNRFRWEDVDKANLRKRAVERVQSVIFIEDVISVKSQGLDRHATDVVMALLSVTFEPGDDGTGVLSLKFAGDGDMRIEVEALEVGLRDVTRPYIAPSGRAPHHDL